MADILYIADKNVKRAFAVQVPKTSLQSLSPSDHEVVPSVVRAQRALTLHVHTSAVRVRDFF